MHDGLKNLESMVEVMLSKEALPTPERIRELIAQLRQTPMCQDVGNDAAERLALEFEERHGVSMTIGSVLQEDDYEPWLPEAKREIDPYYWSRYRKLLSEKHFSGQVLAMQDEVTDRILGLLENPRKDGPWDRRGMVVGHVQSGKTANYTGVACKAADAGYRLIVIIAGIHNNLRNQTQSRVDEGLVGRDSARLMSNKGPSGDRYIGVGRFDRTRRPVTFTNSLRDFSKAMATSVGVPLENLNQPAVFVIKKNASTLKNLLEWLEEHNSQSGRKKISTPMLLIDDEADNASINVKHGKDEVSRINGQIRQLLQIFDRSCYIGYTATPFANIFIDPETEDEMRGADLFPKDFIVSLDPPSNYMGSDRVFLDETDRFIRHISDNEDLLPIRHKKDHVIVGLPESLKTAIRTFAVARAIRLSRGQNREHCSMLVNSSRFTEVQRQLRNEIHNFVDDLKASIRVNGGLPGEKAVRDPEIAALRRVFLEEFDAECGFDWGEIQPLLFESLAPIVVVEVNSRSSGGLNYAEYSQHGLNVIAVGGFSLSRGLTLEGLMVSYFLRNSMMYDTLMQMGRWFGYRPGYEDLCRIWMPEEAEGWYAHISESIEELRDELRSMEAANATPVEFGLKVRSHPDTLVVTARNKMGSGEKVVVSIGLANKFVETAILHADETHQKANRRVAVAFAETTRALGCGPESGDDVSGGRLVQGVPAQPVIDFVSHFRNHPGSMLTDSGPIRNYIEARAAGELAEWDVLFTSTRDQGERSLKDKSLGIPINCQRRSKGAGSDARTLRVTSRQRVASRGVEKTGLTEEQIAAAQRRYREEKGFPGGEKGINYPDRIYRAVRPRPLLIIHLLAIGGDEEDLSGGEPVVAWSISFPTTETDQQKVEYVVNTTWLQENYGQDLEEEEMAGDDG